MSKELKPGDKITCFIEQKLPNCLVVRFQNGKAGSGNSTSVFRGVLIDESSPVTKRYFYEFMLLCTFNFFFTFVGVVYFHF